MVSNRLLLALVALAISPVFTAPIPDDDALVVRDEDGSETVSNLSQVIISTSCSFLMSAPYKGGMALDLS